VLPLTPVVDLLRPGLTGTTAVLLDLDPGSPNAVLAKPHVDRAAALTQTAVVADIRANGYFERHAP